MSATETVTPLGHNNPPPDITLDPATIAAQLKAKHAPLLKKAEDLIGAEARIQTTCDSEEYATKLTNFIKQANEVSKLLDKNRLEENKPFKDAGKTVDTLFNSFDNRLESIKNKASRLLTGWLQEKVKKEQKARLEAAEALRKEAEATTANAVALQGAGRRHEAAEVMQAAEKISESANHMEETATKKTAVVAQVQGSAGNASLRTKVVGEIVSKAELDLESLRPFISIDALQRAIDLFIAAGNRELKGAKIYEKSVAAVR